MADQIYNASLIEALWEKIVPGGCVLMEGGKHPTKLIRLKDDIVGLAFQFPKNVRLGDILDFSHYFRWLFANFRECSLIS